MKNYPLLTIKKENRFYNWRNNYVKPLLNQVKDLSYYSYFMIPPYRELTDTQTAESETKNYNIFSEGVFHFENMPIHSFLQLTQSTEVNNKILPAGTWVVSEARDEGTNELSADFTNYIYMPGGYGSFYILTDISYDENTNNYNLLFSYLRNAGEIYGYSPKSNLILNTNRFVIRPSVAPMQLEQRGITVHSADLGTILANDQFTEWYTLGTPMHFIFDESGEEVILDENHTINLEYANTHAYTINSKHNNVSMFYVDFI